MTKKLLSDALGGISDRHVQEMMAFEKKTKRKARVGWKLAAVAACFAMILACIPAVIHMFNPSQMLDPYRQGIEYKVDSILDLPGEYNGTLLVQNLILKENSAIELYYNERGSAENAEDWFSLIILSNIVNEEEILLHCFFDGRTVEEQKVDMVFTKKATESVEINGVRVQLARHSISLNFEYWYYAVFEYDGVVYDVRTKSDRQDYVYEVLHQLLDNK